MAERPPLKLKFGSSKPAKTDIPETPPPASAGPKIKLKVNTKKPSVATPSSTPTSAPKTATKSGRKSKATAKKRAIEEEGSGSDSEPLAKAKPSLAIKPIPKKVKITSTSNASKTPTALRLKTKGKVPSRNLGVGYDSEDDEREQDPTIDDDFILRMQPGEDCEYLRKAVSENAISVKGGADVRMKFLTRDSRRAMVTIRGRNYAAILVDLPCIIEAMKSWNKKDFYKSADVCQMLLVLGRCKNEEEATKYQLPAQKGDFDEKTWQWAHGITPPMRWARKRRFRKRISTRVVEQDEQEVERLLQADDDCIPGTSRYRHIDQDELQRETSFALQESEEDAEGEDDDVYAGNSILESTESQNPNFDADEDDEDLEAHFEREMAKAAEEGEASFEGATSTAATNTAATAAPAVTESPAATPASSSGAAAGTPAGEPSSADDANGAESEDDEEDDNDEDDASEGDDDASAVDDDALELQQVEQQRREEIADLEAAIAREEQRLATTTNAILRHKINKTILTLRDDLEVKKGGSGDDDDADGGNDGDG